MKSPGQIKTDVFRVIKGSALESAVSGKLSKRGRPDGSNLEDIVVSVLHNGKGQIQEAFVNVNIYVPDIQDDTKAYVIHDERVDELCAIANELLEVYNGGEFRFESEQNVYKVEGKNEHFINNKLLYRQCNEIV